MADPYNLKKIGRFYWCCFKLHGERVHRSTKCVMKGDALERCEGWAQEIRDRHDGKVRQVPAPTLAEALDLWCTAQRGALEDRHVLNVRSAIELHLDDLLPLPLDQLDNLKVETARTRYLNGVGHGSRPGQQGEWDLGHTAGGANKVIQHLGSVVGWAVRGKLIKAKPWDLKPLKVQDDPLAVVWPEKVAAFMQYADGGHRLRGNPVPHSATAMRLMLALGLREDEALNARWEWVDRRRKVYQVGESKSRKVREIPIPDWLMFHLEVVFGPRTTRWAGLILTDRNGNPHSGQFCLKPVARCGELLEVPGLTPHSLRRSFATAHWESGTTLSQIQQMMGHRDPATTMKYIIQRPKDQASAQDRVAVLMGLETVPKTALETKKIHHKNRNE